MGPKTDPKPAGARDKSPKSPKPNSTTPNTTMDAKPIGANGNISKVEDPKTTETNSTLPKMTDPKQMDSNTADHKVEPKAKTPTNTGPKTMASKTTEESVPKAITQPQMPVSGALVSKAKDSKENEHGLKTAGPNGNDQKPKAVDQKMAEPKEKLPQSTVPKAADPKAADPKATDPKAADPKAADPKAADPKAAVPKAAVPKATSDQESADLKKPIHKPKSPGKPMPKLTDPEVPAPKPALPKATGPETTDSKMTDAKKVAPEIPAPKPALPKATGPETTDSKMADAKKATPKVTGPKDRIPKMLWPSTTGPVMTVPKMVAKERHPSMYTPSATAPKRSVPKIPATKVRSVSEHKKIVPKATAPKERIPKMMWANTTYPKTTNQSKPESKKSNPRISGSKSQDTKLALTKRNDSGKRTSKTAVPTQNNTKSKMLDSVAVAGPSSKDPKSIGADGAPKPRIFDLGKLAAEGANNLKPGTPIVSRPKTPYSETPRPMTVKLTGRNPRKSPVKATDQKPTDEKSSDEKPNDQRSIDTQALIERIRREPKFFPDLIPKTDLKPGEFVGKESYLNATFGRMNVVFIYREKPLTFIQVMQCGEEIMWREHIDPGKIIMIRQESGKLLEKISKDAKCRHLVIHYEDVVAFVPV